MDLFATPINIGENMLYYVCFEAGICIVVPCTVVP